MKNTQSSPFLREIVSDRYAFFWEVPQGKFNIRDKTGGRLAPLKAGWRPEKIDDAPPFLVCQNKSKHFYAPMRKNPALHRIFCSIDDDAGIKKFASNFGLLGCTRSRKASNPDTDSQAMMLVESLPRWRYELAEMKRLVYLWQLIKNKRHSLLAALMGVEDDGIYIFLAKRKERIAEADSELARKWRLRGEQPQEAALLYLTTCINSRTRGSVYPEALPSYERKVYLLPDNLLSAMWLMFLWEVIGEVRPRRCAGCDTWFDLKRSTRKTCSDRCRKKVSRIRQAGIQPVSAGE